MKKIIALILIILSAGTTTFGQRYNNGQVTTKIITGIVVDKEGEPLAGAYVNATNGAETVETGADGTYIIEVPVWLKKLTASYPGFGSIDVLIKDKKEINFTMNGKLSSLKKQMSKSKK
ncbi:MAG: carboxypeptidase-like regulatory domain-containing protein [Muribaculaceae bacterium]|nr:carboxypeptidase-like regulatory domain-containing protein [Muribaculaceae bacterium]MDE6410293.1 carboxypeptidase-like regulatory domain-containing protein [Muribaculaceae bacterium]